MVKVREDHLVESCYEFSHGLNSDVGLLLRLSVLARVIEEPGWLRSDTEIITMRNDREGIGVCVL